jgi:hypothetical protein
MEKRSIDPLLTSPFQGEDIERFVLFTYVSEVEEGGT